MSSIKSFHDCKTHDEFLEFRRRADYEARCFVNPMRKHGKTGKWEPVGYEFADRFLVHPWVRESVTEGWGKELRSIIIAKIKHLIMHGEPYGDIDSLMPPKEWVDYAKQQAARFAKAAEWQKANRPGGDMSGWLAKLLENNRRNAEDDAA